MQGSTPDGSCSPEKSEPTRLGLDTDKMDSGVGASSNIASFERHKLTIRRYPRPQLDGLSARSACSCRMTPNGFAGVLVLGLGRGVLTTK